MIEWNDVSGGGKDFAPLYRLQCKLSNGGVIGVFGESGAGKSTLLALLAGAILPSAGTLKINGFDTRRETARAKALVGYLPAGYEPDGELTATEYLLFAADVRGVPYERAVRRAQELLERVGLMQKRDVLIAKLTRGEKRLLAIAQTLIGAPAFVLLDAPLSGVGVRDVQRICELIADIGSEKTVFVSARTVVDLQRVCNRAMILRDGVLVDVCEAEGKAFADACAAALQKETPVLSDGAPALPKRRSRWNILTDVPREEIIDTDDKEARD